MVVVAVGHQLEECRGERDGGEGGRGTRWKRGRGGGEVRQREVILFLQKSLCILCCILN